MKTFLIILCFLGSSLKILGQEVILPKFKKIKADDNVSRCFGITVAPESNSALQKSGSIDIESGGIVGDIDAGDIIRSENSLEDTLIVRQNQAPPIILVNKRQNQDQQWDVSLYEYLGDFSNLKAYVNDEKVALIRNTKSNFNDAYSETYYIINRVKNTIDTIYGSTTFSYILRSRHNKTYGEIIIASLSKSGFSGQQIHFYSLVDGRLSPKILTLKVNKKINLYQIKCLETEEESSLFVKKDYFSIYKGYKYSILANDTDGHYWKISFKN